METLAAIAKRTSVRSYKPEQIPVDTLNTILKAGCSAPVASGKYDSLHITVIQDEAILKQLADATSDAVFKMIKVRKNMDFGAKTLVVVSSAPAILAGIEYANAACVLENMVIAAADQNVDGLIWGGPTIAIAQDDDLKKRLGIPEGFKPVLCASFGYAVTPQEAKEHHIEINMV